MAIDADFTIDYNNKRVYHSSGSTVYTVNALYTYLMNTFDELAQMDDTIPMSAQTPTNYTLINGWFMDDESFKYLMTGAIETSGHNNEIRILPLSASGYTAVVAGDIGKTVTGGTTGDTGELLAYNNTTRKWWVRMDDSGDLFDDNDEAITISGGTGAGNMSAVSTTGENLWSNVYTLGTIQSDDSETIYIIQNAAKLTGWWSALHIDVLIKVKETSSFIDSGLITVFLRHYPGTLPGRGNADLYDHFEIDLSGGGRNAVPLATSPDLNNVTDDGVVAGYSDIKVVWVNGTVTHGSVTNGPFQNFETVTWPGSGSGIMLKDASGTMTIGNVSDTGSPPGPANGETITGGTSGATTDATANMTVTKTMVKAFEQGSNYNYSVIIHCASRVLSQFYEYTKYITRGTATFSTYGTKTQSAALSINKLDGEQYITAFRDYDTPANTYSPVKAAPLGTFAGGKFFGARGIWIESMAAADIQNFQLIDADGSTRLPPNKQTLSVTNLLSDDRVSVFRTTSGTTINKAIYTADSGNVTNNTTFVVKENIASDTPSTGIIRIVDTSDTTNSRETRYSYTSWASKTFSGLDKQPGGGGLDREYAETSDTAYVPFIDTTATGTSVSVTVIYSTDRNVLVRVRRYTATAILPFETTGTFASTGYSTSCIRTSDAIVG